MNKNGRESSFENYSYFIWDCIFPNLGVVNKANKCYFLLWNFLERLEAFSQNYTG